uniref:Uncharacterized protein n=1 Tax=Physcomitrium patens TaxID=3218 RepID=A0A2K1KSS9_PHYPA|nr:hypothetical protein PHYPA_003829 [Physcomitrium patens]
MENPRPQSLICSMYEGVLNKPLDACNPSSHPCTPFVKYFVQHALVSFSGSETISTTGAYSPRYVSRHSSSDKTSRRKSS